MGSTLETAIVFSTILIIICAFIIFPLEICGESYSSFNEFEDYIEEYYYGEYVSQRFNTLVVGISENYRLIYGSLSGDLNA